ncbi:MAG: hypothetical protein ACI9XP_001325 [Lentimonas sp.]|jgi:hypothetical protein
MPGLKFRVLLDTKENQEIFRDILVPHEASFEDFYKVIISSFQFKGDQMASFYVSNEDWDKGHEISWMDLSFGDEHEDESPSIMSSTPIHEFIEEKEQKFILVYDFLKMWIFLVELISYEKETPSEVQLVLSVGDAPDEDSKEVSEETFEGDSLDKDTIGFDDMEDGYDEEDFGGFEEFEY